MARSVFTGSIYLDVDNVDQLREQLNTRARIVDPIETMEYGVREFGLLDENAINRPSPSMSQRTVVSARTKSTRMTRAGGHTS